MLSAWLFSCTAFAVVSAYYVPPQVDPWGPSKTPLHHMVDVTNEFGLKVLNEHNFFNENNIAFSPYGLAGILVALYEGVDGDSSFQILESVRFPWNRDIMRVGFRDIHRTLKTYFIPVEGFLTGLALNNENVTFKESYTRILNFYGFDFKPKQGTPMPDYDENTPTIPPTTQLTTYPTTTVQSTSENPTETTTVTTTSTSLSPTVPNGESPPTTEVNSTIDTSNISSTTITTTTTTTPTTTSATITTTLTSEIETTTAMITIAQTSPPVQVTTSDPTTTETTTQDKPETTQTATPNVLDTNGTTTLSQTTIISMDTSTEAMENVNGTPLTSTEPIAAQTTADQDTNASIQTEMVVTNLTATQMGSTNSMTSNMEMTTRPELSTTDNLDIASTKQVTNTETTVTGVNSITETTNSDTLNSIETTTDQVTQLSTTLGVTNIDTSTIDISTTDDSSDIPSTVTTESQVEIISIPTTTNSDNTGTNGSNIETLDRKKRSFQGINVVPPIIHEDFVFHYPRAIRLENRAHSFYGETMFLANGLKRVEVSYMTYDAIMEHAYLPYLKASALKLPLDSDKYYLLVILPEYDFPLDALIKRLAHLSNLRDIFSSLRPKYVHACVPSFMIKGHVSLTTDLQRLGIRDVFEPRQNDFTPMTNNKGVYVRNVEQAITVTIRKYSSAEPSERRYVPNQAPVQFGATYPFLFFVMDSTVNVALMAGKMMDPLNSRIL